MSNSRAKGLNSIGILETSFPAAFLFE